MRYVITLTLVAFLATPALAVPTVDGTRDAEYGPPIVVQAVETQFGDAAPPGALGGSELDAAYATIVGNRLYLMLTGNQEPNFNKLEIFFDTKAGGENTLSNVPQYDFSPSPGVWNSQNLGGLTFDTPFTADYHLLSAWGSGTGPYEVTFVNRNGGAAAMVPGSAEASGPAVGLIAAGLIPAGDIGPNASGTALTQNLQFAINDNNAAGVAGGTAAANAAAAAAVTTGMEFSIDLADLGSPAIGTTIRIAAMIDNGDHNYLSNQILGPLTPPQGNLGGDGGGGFTGTLSGVNFNQFAGAQYFEIRIIPEPSTMVLGGLALLAAAAFSRRGRRTSAATR
jgi:hypothetical protein